MANPNQNPNPGQAPRDAKDAQKPAHDATGAEKTAKPAEGGAPTPKT